LRLKIKDMINSKLSFSTNLFWDADLTELDMERHAGYIVGRVLDYGTTVILLLTSCGRQTPYDPGSGAPRIVNIINFIRQLEPRTEDPGMMQDVLYETVVEQVKQLKQYGLPGTFLLQYDALLNPKYQTLLKNELTPGSEVGAWWEITQPHVESVGLLWRGRFPWDWHANVGFATGYTPAEREKLVDEYMEKFKSIFGKYPASVGSWFIDAHTLGYMSDRYNIVASCNCKDQVGTDGYTLWGGYWNQAYYPSRKNAYMPAQTETGQIPVPIFRMLGSDPIYQYDMGLGSKHQSVVTLEPVYQKGGGERSWVEWFFHTMFEEPCLAFNYVQAGQENSFTWAAMRKGLSQIRASYKGFEYSIVCKKGSFAKTEGCAFRILPDKGKIAVDCSKRI
jgi:hypothetical protein